MVFVIYIKRKTQFFKDPWHDSENFNNEQNKEIICRISVWSKSS